MGYGDIVPGNSQERVFCIGVMLVGVFFYSYTIGMVSSFFQDTNSNESERQMKDLQVLYQKYKLPRDFYLRVKDTIEYENSHSDARKWKTFTSLPGALLLQLKFVMNEGLVRNNKFFREKSAGFVKSMLAYFIPVLIKSTETVYTKGDDSEEIYLILQGEIGLFETVSSKTANFLILERFDYFGDIEVILNEPRLFTATGLKRTEALLIQKKELVTSVFPKCEQEKHLMTVQVISEKRRLLRISKELMSNYTKSMDRIEPRNSAGRIESPLLAENRTNVQYLASFENIARLQPDVTLVNIETLEDTLAEIKQEIDKLTRKRLKYS